MCPRGNKAWLNLFRETSGDGALLRRREVEIGHPPEDGAVRAELLALKDDEHGAGARVKRQLGSSTDSIMAADDSVSSNLR